jgi:O-antigen/teichoic acid export membrane protein
MDEPTFPVDDSLVAPTGFARLTGDSFVYALGSVAGKAISLLMVPLVTRLLPPIEYGRLDLLSTLGSAVISILWLGADVAVIRTLAARDSNLKAPEVVGSFLGLLALLAVPWLAVMIFAAPALSVALFGDGRSAFAIRLVAAVVATGTFQIAMLTILRARRQPARYSIVMVSTLFLGALSAVALLLGWRHEAEAMLAALVIGQGLGAVLGLLLVGGGAVARPRLSIMRSLLLLGVPLAPFVFATYGAEFANRDILLAQSGPAELGFLSVALRFASLIGLALSGFQLAWQPHAFALGSGPEGRVHTGRNARRILVAITLLFSLTAFLTRDLVLIISGGAYSDAIRVVGPLLIAGLGAALFMVLSMPSALDRSLRDIGLAGSVGAMSGVVLNLALAGPWGAMGTAVALAAGQLLGCFVLARLGRRHVQLVIPWARLAVLMSAAAVVAVLSTQGIGAPLGLRAVLFLGVLGIGLWEGTLLEAFRFAVAAIRQPF